MAKGLRFFGTDYNSNVFEPTVTVSSADNNKAFMFDGLIATRWISSGEGTDGNAVSIEVDYGTNREIDSFYVYNTNIDDIAIYYDDGGWVEVTDVQSESSDGYYVFMKLNTAVVTDKVRITGSNTIIASEEKYVTLFHSFLQLGQFEYFPDFTPRIEPFQSVFKITDGRNFIIERGEEFSAVLDFKSHISSADITLYTELIERKTPFFVWPNGGDDTIFTFNFEPYRFRDIYKVAVVGIRSPKYTKNYYKAGLNTKLNIVEVA